MQNEDNPIFGPDDIISTYPDSQAIEDGILVAINPRDRVTRSVWEWLVEKQPKGSSPPGSWPGGMMGGVRAAAITKRESLAMIAKHGKEEGQRKYELMVRDRKAHALSIGLIDQNRDRAKRTYDENTDGGIFNLIVRIEAGTIWGIIPATEISEGSGAVALWLLPNENGGITLLFPSDY